MVDTVVMNSSSSTEDISRQRRAKNEAAFRHHNERIRRLSKQLLDGESRQELPIRFLCECSTPDCVDPVEVVLATYEGLRRNAGLFIVVNGHEQRDIETIVERLGRYILVEKNGDLQAAI